MASSSGTGTKAAATARLNEGISKLFNSHRLSDITVRCGGREWPAHKMVLCTQSDFFAKACEGDFKESEQDAIELHDDDPDGVEAMLRFFYTFDYSDSYDASVHSSADFSDEDVSPALFNVRVYALAEKYVLEHLRSHAATKFAAAAESSWGSDSFADAIAEAYSTTYPTEHDEDSELRKAIMDVVMRHADELLSVRGRHQHFREVACQVPGFAVHISGLLLERLAAKESWQVYECPSRSCVKPFKSNVGPGQEVVINCTWCNEET